MEKEKLEIDKLQLEIKKLSQPFYKNPAHLSIITTLILGFLSYYIVTDKAKEQQIMDLKEQIGNLSDKEASIEKTQVELKADHYQRQFLDFKNKKEEVEKSIQLKEIKLMNLSDKLENSKKEYDNFKSKLIQVQGQYEATIAEYEAYKSRVSAVIDEVASYGPNYARGLIQSPEGQQQINFIVSQDDKGLMKSEIERFAFGVSNQAFDQSLARKRIDLKIQ
ncbi:hypothetical protein ACFSYG_04660 [Leeuwenhoekiella polynyae]|uniref:Uncharacterized protein n=1 Tax=Leeuwenhoekiella polynyae TaxID=1550906 RepID=A0A4Q0P3V3_9FLAO|nr:hypothetical protein [Leeuwenhoekiella polynyae]RXG21005.1 hypothetical protein DSM02_2376 [Leeuwenhoekiella polynyae]